MVSKKHSSLLDGVLDYREAVQISLRDKQSVSRERLALLKSTASSMCYGLIMLLLCFSLYDIHLDPRLSPTPIYDKVRPRPMARRAIIMVADGLRADVAYAGFDGRSELPPNMPFILGKVRGGEAQCGIVTADAPTESRPNHQAMLGGFPEELRNALPLLKVIDRDFDHVLRRAEYGFALGGPDVVTYFKGPKVQIRAFPLAYYGDRATSELDKWTLDEFRKLLKDPAEAEALRSEGVVIFLHLAGVDAAGHRFGALSPAYRDNAKYLDTLAREIESLVNEFHGDEQTLWIFTADHGFPDVGSHGDRGKGTQECPLVVWGPHIGTGQAGGNRVECGERTMRQHQLSPLIAGSLGIPLPANNLAQYPLDPPLVQLDTLQPDQLQKLLLANLGQLVNEYCVQARKFREKSLFGYFAVASCEGKRSDVERFEGSLTRKDASQKLRLSLSGVQCLRWYLFLWKGLLAALPTILACLGIFVTSPSELFGGSVRPLRRMLLSLMVAVLWYCLGYKTAISGVASFFSGWLWQGYVRSETFDEMSRVSATLGFSIYLGLFEPRLLLLSLVPIGFALKAVRSESVVRTLLLAGPVFSLALSPPALIQHIVPVIIIPTSLYGVVKLSNYAADELFLLRSGTVALGIILKLHLLMPTDPVGWQRSVLTIFLLLGATTFAVLFLLARRIRASEGTTLLLCDATIVSLFTFIVDPALLMTCTVGTYLLALLGSKCAPQQAWMVATAFVALVLLMSSGPMGLAAVGSSKSYHLGFIGKLLIPWHYQVPLAGAVGIFILVTSLKLAGIVEDYNLMSLASRLAMKSASLACILCISYIRRDESWREVCAGLAKCLLTAALPLIVVMASLVYSLWGCCFGNVGADGVFELA